MILDSIAFVVFFAALILVINDYHSGIYMRLAQLALFAVLTIGFMMRVAVKIAEFGGGWIL